MEGGRQFYAWVRVTEGEYERAARVGPYWAEDADELRGALEQRGEDVLSVAEAWEVEDP